MITRLPGILLALLVLHAPSVFALDSKKIYQINEDRVFQIRVLNRETGKKSSIGSGFIDACSVLISLKISSFCL